MTEKPLHVRVAEALGWTSGNADRYGCPVNEHGWAVDSKGWFGRPPHDTFDAAGRRLVLAHVPRYDTDWSVTGPLIERLGVHVTRQGTGRWAAWGGNAVGWRWADTPLVAVCAVIVALPRPA